MASTLQIVSADDLDWVIKETSKDVIDSIMISFKEVVPENDVLVKGVIKIIRSYPSITSLSITSFLSEISYEMIADALLDSVFPIQHLYLSHSITNLGLAKILLSLQTNTTVSRLSLRGFEFCESICMALVKIIKKNISITKLDFIAVKFGVYIETVVFAIESVMRPIEITVIFSDLSKYDLGRLQKALYNGKQRQQTLYGLLVGKIDLLKDL